MLGDSTPWAAQPPQQRLAYIQRVLTHAHALGACQRGISAKRLAHFRSANGQWAIALGQRQGQRRPMPLPRRSVLPTQSLICICSGSFSYLKNCITPFRRTPAVWMVNLSCQVILVHCQGLRSPWPRQHALGTLAHNRTLKFKKKAQRWTEGSRRGHKAMR